jgi:hypothetical protein
MREHAGFWKGASIMASVGVLTFLFPEHFGARQT